MADEKTNKRRPPCRCGECGKVVWNVKWRPALACPACGRGALNRVAAPEGAFEYFLADRGNGPSREDRRLLRTARWAGLIDVNTAAQCLQGMRVETRQGKAVGTAGDWLLRIGAATGSALAALLRASAADPDPEAEEDLARLARTEASVSEKQIGECLRLQQRHRNAGRRPPRLGHLLIEGKMLADVQVARFLKDQRQRGLGILSALSTVEKHVQKRRRSNDRPRVLDFRGPGWLRAVALPAALCLLVLGGLGFVAHSGADLARPATEVRTACGHCGEAFAPTFTTVRIPCPGCRRERAVRSTSCPRCEARMVASEAMDAQVRPRGDTRPVRAFCPICMKLFAVPAETLAGE